MGDPMDMETWGTPTHRTRRTPLMRQRYLPMSARKRANLMFSRQKARTYSSILAARSKRSQAAVRFGGWTNPKVAEIKSVDVTTTVPCDSNGFISLLNGVARGTDVTDRIGRSIVMNGLQLRLHGYTIGTTGVDQIQRILVVMDRQANGAPPSITSVLDSVDVLSPYNRDNRLRFNVLADFNVVLNHSGEPGSMWCRTLYLNNVRGAVQQFNTGDTASVSSITTNSIYLIAIGNIGSGPQSSNVYFSSRFFFKDS